jgi:hypothetical protein
MMYDGLIYDSGLELGRVKEKIREDKNSSDPVKHMV